MADKWLYYRFCDKLSIFGTNHHIQDDLTILNVICEIMCLKGKVKMDINDLNISR